MNKTKIEWEWVWINAFPAQCSNCYKWLEPETNVLRNEEASTTLCKSCANAIRDAVERENNASNT